MPQTFRSISRLFELIPELDSIRVDFTRDTIRCEILRPDADTKPLIEHESKRPTNSALFSSTAVDAAVYELKKLHSLKPQSLARTAQDAENEKIELIERLKHIDGIHAIKALDGYEIRVIRETLGMSYDEFARAMICSTATVYRWETGRGKMSNSFADRFLTILERRNLAWVAGQQSPALVTENANAGTADITGGIPGVVDGMAGVWLPINPEPAAPLDPHWNDWPPQEPEG